MIYITINSKDVKPIGYIVKEDSNEEKILKSAKSLLNKVNF